MQPDRGLPDMLLRRREAGMKIEAGPAAESKALAGEQA